MFVANICFQRPGRTGPGSYIQIGKVWFSAVEHRCSLLFYGLRMGQFYAKPHNQNEAPYLKGDIMVDTGEYMENNIPVKARLWCGWMWTDSDQRGPVYNGVIEVDPMPSLVQAVVRDAANDIACACKAGDVAVKARRGGVFLPVFLEDK